MKADIFWTKGKYPGKIALVARPRGGDWLEDEAAAWADAGLDIIVSMLEPVENEEFGLDNEGEYTAANGIEFILFPVPDRGVPALDQRFLKLTEKLRDSLLAGKAIGIHCRQSIGRAPLLAAALMTMFGIEPAEAFRRLSDARGRVVPETHEQAEWVKNFADKYALAMA